MSEPVPLRLEGVSFRYRDRPQPAIKDLTFEVRRGEILLIAGASGCGKTTLVRAINGLIPRSYKGELTGSVLIGGSDTLKLKLSQISQRVGTVLQDPERQILGTKVLNEVAFGLENLGLPREEILRRSDESLDRLQITHLRGRETFHLSGGEKQKVALAGVLAMRPEILLLDEPLASLDPASAEDALDTVRLLADAGMTILMIEHRVEDALRARPDRVMFMSDGQIRYLGNAAGLSEAVDYRAVKLPADLVMMRARAEQRPPEAPPAPVARHQTADGKLVQFENVSFSYEGGAEVLHELTLEIRRGDIVAVLGANGAGKTTLVKHAIGLLKPTAGRVLVDGRDTRASTVAQIAAAIGYVFQSPSHMLFAPTVHDELAFGPSNLKHPKDQIEKEVKEALRIVNLADLEKDPPLALSFGQQKRVSIAAVLAMQSRILVMDEPTAGQDYQNYLSFMDSILEMPSFDAILFITHDVDLAVIYANRVVMIADGRLVADGPPGQVLSDFERMRANRLRPTSLLAANLRLVGSEGRFLRAEALAQLTPHS